MKQRSLMNQLIGGTTLNKVRSGWSEDGDVYPCTKDVDEPEYKGTGDLMMGHKLEIALKFPYESVYKFHLSVWRECCPNATEAFLMVTMNNRRDEHDKFMEEFIIVFKDEAHKAESVAWWDAYAARYHDLGATRLPEFTTGQTVNGYAMSTMNEEDSHYRDDWDLFPEWVWIVKNTTGKVHYTREFWFFEDSSELVQFKLTGVIPRGEYNF